MNVWKSTPDGRPRPASRESPVPRMNRNSTGWTSEVTARSRSVRNLISSRRQTMLTARRSARMLRSGTATRMRVVRSPSPAPWACSAAARSFVAIATSLPRYLAALLPSAEARGDPAVAVADRGLRVPDRLAGVGHEHIIEGGPGHAHRLDRDRQAREQLGHEVLPRFHRERHQALVHARLQVEHLRQGANGGRVVRGADLDAVFADGGLQRLRRVDGDDGSVVDD